MGAWLRRVDRRGGGALLGGLGVLGLGLSSSFSSSWLTMGTLGGRPILGMGQWKVGSGMSEPGNSLDMLVVLVSCWPLGETHFFSFFFRCFSFLLGSSYQSVLKSLGSIVGSSGIDGMGWLLLVRRWCTLFCWRTTLGAVASLDGVGVPTLRCVGVSTLGGGRLLIRELW